ncbi:MAG TPA: PAS domain S-box protein [Magnetospirillaceae bacterium]|jgi:PAS domain S-box-containing protein
MSAGHPLFSPRTLRIAIPAAILVIGAACSGFAFWQAQEAEKISILSVLELRAAWRAGDMQNKLDRAVASVRSLRTFVVSQNLWDSRDRDDNLQFHIFASQARGKAPISRLLWAPIVRDEKRAAFEAKAAADNGAPNYQISAFGPDGQLKREGPHDVYAPVEYEQSFDKKPPLLSFDLLSETQRRAAAEMARDLGTSVISPVLLPLPGQGAEGRIIIYTPVYERPIVPDTLEGRRDGLVGYTVGSFQAKSLFEYALADTPEAIETLSLVADLPTNMASAIPIVQYRPAPKVVDTYADPLGTIASGGIRLTRSFESLGHDWTLVFDFAPATVGEMRTPAPWGYLGLGLALTIALTSYVVAQQRRQSLVEGLIAERTDALQSTTNRLTGMIETAPDGIISIDRSGTILQFNAAAEMLFGYDEAEVLHQNVKMLMPAPFAQEHDQYLDNYHRTGERHVIGLGREVTGRRKDGSIFPLYLAVGEVNEAGETSYVGILRDLTAAKRAEQLIADERDTAQRYLDVAGVMILVLDLEFRITLINRHGCRMVGYSSAVELIGRSWIDTCIPENEREAIRRKFQQLITSGDGDFEFNENMVVTKSGAHRMVAWHNTIFTDVAGKIVGTLSSGEDVTERRQAELALRRSQEHLARVQSIARIGSSEYNYQTGEITWSDEIYRFIGDPPVRDTKLSTFMDVVHPDDRGKLTALAQRGREGQDVEPMEFRIVGGDGITRWFYRQSQLTRDEKGEPLMQIATVFDITGRKIAEAARMASEEQYRLTFDMAPVGIAHVDLEGKFMLVNQAMCSMFLYGEADLLGHNFREFTHPDDMAVSDPQTQQLVNRQATTISWEKRFIRKDGTTIWCQLTSTLTAGNDKTPAHYVTVYIDVTAAKLSEEKRHELEAQLVQAQKMEAVGRLTGGVAHDFNNLLTVVLGNLDLVREQVEENAKLVRQIDAATAAGKRGADLTHRLLAFSRQQPLEPVSVDINKRVAELIPMLHRTLGETIEVKQKLGRTLWRVVVDPGQFENAILNLAVNSRDAMTGGGKLVITTENIAIDDAYAATRRELSPGNYVRVSVSDSGSGMPPEIIAKAFDPFFTTKDVGKGTGLGLSMVYGFVKQSGGHAAIYSEVGIGTTVTLLLPADASSAVETVQTKTFAPMRGNETILVVEDDPAVRAVTVSFLDALGYSVIQAGTVVEGYELFAALPDIDLILTDVILPGGADGAALARKAREIRPDTKVLFMSGYTEDVVMHNGRLDAGVALLRKPFTRGQLAQKVRAVIDGELIKN